MPIWKVALLFVAATCAFARQPFFDKTYHSKVLGEQRNYRILLPAGYETSERSYPVIYYLHGHSDRYTVENYDNGTDTIPKMVDFVAKHPVIVVCADGYVAKDYTGFYGGSPYDVMTREGGDYDFGPYFLELVKLIDSNYRTLTDRRNRAISGLSMGGFMALYLSARYPHAVGSASSFNPAAELYVGEKGARLLWTPKNHVFNHTHSMVRLIRASGDYISQYHEELKEAYANAHDVDFEYRLDEYHRHWATSIGETFEFHLRAFENPTLNNFPEVFSHSNAFRSFDVWGYRVESAGKGAGYTYLEDVSQGGLRVLTREWAPDGPAVPGWSITVTTAPLYSSGKKYAILDHSFQTGRTERRQVTADVEGRITFTVDGAGHQISFAGPGTGAQVPILLPLTRADKLRLPPGKSVSLPVRVYNPRGVAMTDVRVSLTSEYPTVAIEAGSARIPKIEPGAYVDVSDRMKVRLTAGAGHFAPTRLELHWVFDDWHSAQTNIDVLAVPEVIPDAAAIQILDGRTVKLNVFRQKGNQGGGGSIERTATEGKGNGNGVLEPGEEATIWVKMPQGMDAFDKNNWYRCKVFSDSPLITEVGDFQEQKQLEWTGGKERTSLIRLAPSASSGTAIPLLLDNESWSYHFTPDVRCGREKLYQAMQLHTRHLHRYVLKVQ